MNNKYEVDEEIITFKKIWNNNNDYLLLIFNFYKYLKHGSENSEIWKLENLLNKLEENNYLIWMHFKKKITISSLAFL